MKKNGFTLAEVLITLTIIGVIATMTLPALMTNTQEQQAKTGLKKGISTLTDISQMNQAIDGYNYASLRAGTFGIANPEDRSLYAMLANRGSIDLQKSNSSPKAGIDYDTTALNFAPDAIVYFRDGSALLYNNSDAVTGDTNGKLMADGLPLGFTVVFDTNGAKGPNVLSNCEGTTTGTTDTVVGKIFEQEDGSENLGSDAEDDLNKACVGVNTKKRVIKDQFTVQLRGDVAVPYGAAAVWAYNN